MIFENTVFFFSTSRLIFTLPPRSLSVAAAAL
jgi:hypothetical protein